MFRVYINHDVVGCEVGGALKNVIAIAAGIADGLGVGDNTRAAVMTRGLAELTRLGVAMGGEAITFAGLAGMGDLIATCISPHSRNRHVGEQLGRGGLADILAEMNMVAEGVKTATTARQLARKHGVPMPVCDEMLQVVSGRSSASTPTTASPSPPGTRRDPGVNPVAMHVNSMVITGAEPVIVDCGRRSPGPAGSSTSSSSSTPPT